MTITMKPGIYQNVNFETYNALPYARNSYLKKMSTCPASALVEMSSDSPALTIGRASHALILEGEEAFTEGFVVLPADSPKRPGARTINAAKPSAASLYAIQWWEQFSALCGSKEIISGDEYAILQAMRKSVRNHPFAKMLLADGVSEQTVIFDVDVDGTPVRCKVRPDRTPSPKTSCLIDLKSCMDASYRGFLNACYRFGYFHQAAMYIDGYNKARDIMIAEHGWNEEDHPPIDAFAFIAVEKTPPFRVEVYTLMGDNTLLVGGYDEYRNNLAIEARCRKQGYYPNYQDAGAQELLPFNERP